MTQKQLLEMFDFLEKSEEWLFDVNLVCFYLSEKNRQNVKISLSRFCKSNLVVRVVRNFYVNPRARNMPAYPLEVIARRLRYNIYLSLEARLSEEGLISQIPNRLTFISQGRSQTFFTPYGIIEFVHSKQDAKNFLNDCFFDEARKIWVANSQKAIRDIYRHNRSVDLYEEELEKKGIDE